MVQRHTIRLPGVILDEVGQSYDKDASGLSGSSKRKLQASRKDRRKKERLLKKKKHNNEPVQQNSHSTNNAKTAPVKPEPKDEKKKEKKKPKNPEIERHKQLMAEDEAEMEHYAKLLKMKNYKLADQGDGLDDLLGDLDFDNFDDDQGSDSEGDGGDDDQGGINLNFGEESDEDEIDFDEDMDDDIEEMDGDDDATEGDTWAALKAMKAKKDLAKSKPKQKAVDEDDDATEEDTWAALKAMKAKKDLAKSKPKQDPVDEDSVEDTWAALKKLKESKKGKEPMNNKKHESEDDEDTDGLSAESDDDEDIGSEEFSEFEGFDHVSGDDDNDNDEQNDEDKESSASSKQKTNAKENPYRAPSSGAVTAAYVPPSKRAAMAGDDSSETARILERKVKGLLNRLAESNIVGIVNDLCMLYSSYSRSLVNESITNIVLNTTKAQPTVVENFLIVHAALVAGLYRRYGVDFGAYFVQTLVETIDPEKLKSQDPSNSLTTSSVVNLLVLLCQAYMFEMVSSRLLYDLIKAFLLEISETHVEYLLTILRSAGPQLRSDDPGALKEIIVMLQKQLVAVSETTGKSQNARTKFLVESVVALKNNRQKLSSSTAEAITRMKKFLGQFSKTDPLQVTLHDVREIDTKGRWWIVGAAYRNDGAGLRPGESRTEEHNSDAPIPIPTRLGSDGKDKDDLGLETADLSTLASAQRMNTDVRRAIFVAIMSATDYLDSVERIMRLRLSNKQEREIPLVLVHCCANEDTYNPFYSLVATKLASGDRAIRKAFQFILWTQLDSFTSGGSHSLSSVVHTAKLFGHMAGQSVLSLDILKTADFYTSSPLLRAFLEVFFVDTLGIIGKRFKKSPARDLDAALDELLEKCTSDSSLLQNIMLFQKAVLNSTAIPSDAKSIKRIKATSAALTAKISKHLETETF